MLTVLDSEDVDITAAVARSALRSYDFYSS